MANNQQPQQNDQAVHGLRAMYENDPFGYNLAIQRAGDQQSIGTPNFLGGPGGIIAHDMQTVFDAAQLQADAQGKDLHYDPRHLPGQNPLPSTQGDQAMSGLRAQFQNYMSPRANFYSNATTHPYKPF